MFGAYLQGFIGLMVMIVGGVLLALGGVIMLLSGGTEGLLLLASGVLLLFVGGYFRYLSQQTTRTVDMYSDQTAGNVGDVASPAMSRSSYTGERSLDSDEYQLYLVEKYKITKNETLGKFVVNGKLFGDLKDALKVADELDKPVKLVSPPDFNLLVKEHTLRTPTGASAAIFELSGSRFYLERVGGYLEFPSLISAEEFLKRN